MIRLFLIFLMLIISSNAFANIELHHSIDWFMLLVSLFGGLSLFLYGMDKMSTGMKQVAGNKMKLFLSVITKNRFIGLGVGMFVTMIVQSSSATTVMLVSFVEAGLLRFVQTLGVILGASIGTTVTAQLVAFKITDYALLVLTLGFFIRLLSKNDKYRQLGTAVFGFGLLFFGMKLMSDAMAPLRTFDTFINLIESLENPVWGILFGALFTGIIQSSSAFMGIIIVLAKEDLISLSAGIPLIIGTNIGTCITAMLASIGLTRNAKRVAVAHVSFKVLGALLFLGIIPYFTVLVKTISDYFGFHNARDIANAHTIYNVTLAFLFLPFTPLFVKLIYKIIPEPKDKVESSDLVEKELKPVVRHLDDSLISNPAVAIELARNEIFQMIKLMEKMVEFIIIPFIDNEITNDRKYPQLSIIEGIQVRENKIDYLEVKVSKYLIKVSQQELDDRLSHEIFGMISIMNDIESVADIIDKNMLSLIAKKEALKMDFSSEGQEEIKIFHFKICKQISRIKNAFASMDVDVAQRSVEKMELYLDLEEEYRMKHLLRLKQQKLKTVETHEVHMEIMDYLKQINVYAGEMGKIIKNLSKTKDQND